MKPFEIKIRLLTPMIVTRYPVTLDSLLWHTLFLHYHNEQTATDHLSDYLHQTDGVYHASSLYFGVTPQQTLIACNYVTVGVMRPGKDLHPDLFKPTAKNGEKYTNVIVEGGHYRNRIGKHNAYYAPYLVFYGNGNSENIAAMFEYYLLAIGKEANRGVGQIGAINVKEINVDRSHLDEKGHVSRPLPVDLYTKLTGDIPVQTQDLAMIPPYRTHSRQACIVPERIQKIIL